jgi:hypothetical protein
MHRALNSIPVKLPLWACGQHGRVVHHVHGGLGVVLNKATVVVLDRRRYYYGKPGARVSQQLPHRRPKSI